jgi:hypothetical protein
MKSKSKFILSTKVPFDFNFKNNQSNKFKYMLVLIILSSSISFTGLSQEIKNDSIVTLNVEIDTLKTKCKTTLDKVKFDSISKGSSFEEYEFAVYILEHGLKNILDDKDVLGFQYQTTDPETGDALIPWQITFSVDERGNISFKGISNAYGIYSID